MNIPNPIRNQIPIHSSGQLHLIGSLVFLTTSAAILVFLINVQITHARNYRKIIEQLEQLNK